MIVLVVSQNQCKITTKIPHKQILNNFYDNIIQILSEIGEFCMMYVFLQYSSLVSLQRLGLKIEVLFSPKQRNFHDFQIIIDFYLPMSQKNRNFAAELYPII